MFLPGESQGRGSLVGCHLWGRIESDMTDTIEQQQLITGASLVSHRVNNRLVMQKTRIRSLGQEDPMERRERLPIPVFLPREIHGWEAERLQSMGSQRVGQDRASNTFTHCS